MTVSPARSQGWSWWAVVVAAAISYSLLSYLDDWISLPLREVSSVIAGWLLDLIGYPITRDGTIISTANFRFEVVPACSGSTSLKLLLALGITWCGSHPGLTPLRRLIAIAAAAPLAVLINGLRVAALVAIGDSLLQPLEGTAHEAIGIMTFMLAIACLFLLGESLVQRESVSAGSRRDWLRPTIVTVLVGLLGAPPLLWSVTAWWSSPLDHFGWAFALLGAGGVVWAWRRVGGPVSPIVGGGLLIVSLGLVLGGALVEVFLSQAVGILGVLLAMAWWTGGWKRARVCLPFLAAAGIGLPVVGFALTTRSGLEGPMMSLVLRSLVFVLCGGLGLLLLLRVKEAAPSERPPLSMVLVALLAAALAVESAMVTGRGVPEPLRYDISWLQGSWVGAPTETDPAAIELLGREHVDTRAYRNDRGGVIQMIITTTGGDRHRAHPPEYCMTGAGWQIQDRRTEQMVMLGIGIPVTRLSLSRQALHQTMVYWFTDGGLAVGSYSDMLSTDTKRRLVGHRSDWALFRVIGDPSDVESFLRDFHPQIRSSAARQLLHEPPIPAAPPELTNGMVR